MGTELRCYGRMSNYYPSTAILLVTLNIFYYLLTNESDRSFSTQKCLLLYIYICICIFTDKGHEHHLNFKEQPQIEFEMRGGCPFC